MLYSAIERHIDGGWWYHGDTFENREEAEQFLLEWIWWDKDRPKRIYEHLTPFPLKTMVSYDLRKFRNPY